MNNEILALAWKKVKTHQAKNQILEQILDRNQFFIDKFAQKVRNPRQNSKELKQEIIERTRTRLDEFDPTMGYKFATRWVHELTAAVNEYNKTAEILHPTNRKETKAEKRERMRYNELTGKNIQKPKGQVIFQETYSLNRPIGDSEKQPIELIQAKTEEESEINKFMHLILSPLDNREKKTIKRYFGLEDGVKRTIRDLCTDTQTTHQAISLMINRAKRKIKAHVKFKVMTGDPEYLELRENYLTHI